MTETSTKPSTKTEIATILVAESDQITLELLCEHLTADRFNTLAAPTVEDAWKLFKDAAPDLVLLDLGFGRDAVELVTEVREHSQGKDETPPGLIVISRRASERDRIRCLSEGADDHIQRPFSYGEMLTRINAVLRRRQAEPVTRVGNLEINHVRQTVAVDGRTVRLSQKEFGILKVLATDPGRVFSKEELLQEVWGYRSAGHTRTLEAHCARLRKKLDPNHGRMVVCCWGVGYRLVGP